jgi:hypothetical protein
MGEYVVLMNSLYNTGAFSFVNMPPLKRPPMVVENGRKIVENYAEGVELFNDHLLPRYVNNFTATHSGVQSIICNAHSSFSKIPDHPSWYGFKNNFF